MKRVSITFLPLMSVTIPPQVLQTPPYIFIQYATTTISNFFVILSRAIWIHLNLSISKYFKDITIILTKVDGYISFPLSHIVHSFQNDMWTITTTIANNKTCFVTLITPLHKFEKPSASGFPVNHWFQYDKYLISKITNSNPPRKP